MALVDGYQHEQYSSTILVSLDADVKVHKFLKLDSCSLSQNIVRSSKLGWYIDVWLGKGE